MTKTLIVLAALLITSTLVVQPSAWLRSLPSGRRSPAPGRSIAGRPAALRRHRAGDPASRRITREAGDEILADDRRSMEPHEYIRIQPFFKRGHAVVDQPAATPDVEPHVITLGRDPVDVARRDPDQPDKSEAQNSSSHCDEREAAPVSVRLFEIASSPVERALQPSRIDRLHQIIDGFDLEGSNCKLVERSDEHHCRRGNLGGKGAGNANAVEAGHGDVEEQDVGMERFRQVDGACRHRSPCPPGARRRLWRAAIAAARPQAAHRPRSGPEAARQPSKSTRHHERDLVTAAGNRPEAAAGVAMESGFQALADVGQAKTGAFVGRGGKLFPCRHSSAGY